MLAKIVPGSFNCPTSCLNKGYDSNTSTLMEEEHDKYILDWLAQ